MNLQMSLRQPVTHIERPALHEYSKTSPFTERASGSALGTACGFWIALSGRAQMQAPPPGQSVTPMFDHDHRRAVWK